MIDIIILELISLISFLYSIILMFTSFAPISHMGLIFVFTFVVALIFTLNYRKSKLFEAFYLLLFLPMLFYRSKTAIFFYIVVGALTYVYIKKSLLRGNHHEYVEKLILSYGLLVFLVIMRSPFIDLSGTISDSLIFMVIYLISSTLLARLQRHIDTKMDLKKIRKTNIKYLMILAIAFFFLVFESLRSGFANAVDGLIRLLYYPLYLLTRNIDFSGDWGLEENIFFTPYIPEQQIPMEEIGEAVTPHKASILVFLDIFVKIIVFIVAIVIVYLAYKLLMKIGERKDTDTLDYIEEREFIRDGKKEKKRKTRLFKDRFPRGPKDQVRYYYRKYLNKVRSVNEIEPSDTSLDVNNKATGFDREVIEKIREIYINIRYGNKEAKAETVKEMEDLCKKL